MKENDITGLVIDKAYKIHKTLGPGLFESVYEEILTYELKKEGLKIERQKAIPVIWDDLEMELGFRSDLIIENKVIVEIKSVEEIIPVHSKQILTYLKLTDIKVGLLINFNEELIKHGIKSVVNNF